MKKLALLFVCTILGFSVANAKNGSDNNSPKVDEQTAVQTYSIRGSIFDPKYNEEVSGATITIEGKKFYSDLSGNFAISVLTKGKHTITVDFVSYQTKSMEIDLSNNQDLKIELVQR